MRRADGRRGAASTRLRSLPHATRPPIRAPRPPMAAAMRPPRRKGLAPEPAGLAHAVAVAARLSL